MKARQSSFLWVTTSIGLAANIVLQLVMLDKLGNAEGQKIFLSCIVIPAFLSGVIFGPYQNILLSKFCAKGNTKGAWICSSSLFTVFLAVSAITVICFPFWSPIYFGSFLESQDQIVIYRTFVILMAGMPFNVSLAVVWAAAVSQKLVLKVESISATSGCIALCIAFLVEDLSPESAGFISIVRYPIQLLLMTSIVKDFKIGFNISLVREILSGAEWASALSVTGRFDQVVERMVLVREAGNTLTGYFMAQQIASLVASVSQRIIISKALPDFIGVANETDSRKKLLLNIRKKLAIIFCGTVAMTIVFVLVKSTAFARFVNLFFSGLDTMSLIYCVSILTLSVIIGTYAELYCGMCHAKNKSNLLALSFAPVNLVTCALKLWLGSIFGWQMLPLMTLASYGCSLVISEYISKKGEGSI